MYAALNGQTQGFVVYDFHTGDNTTGGEWTDDPNHLPFLNVTRFTDENADFQSYMVGWTIIADVEKPSFLTIFAVPTATRVEVFGDATGLSADGQTYRLVAPPGVDPTTGALSKPNTVLSKRANNRGCTWLWSGYQYVPPQVGHESGGSTTGAQGGINKLGTYYCWNRTYDVFMGRWTTPDPAATPWGNLWDYVGGNPAQRTDSTGLTHTQAQPHVIAWQVRMWIESQQTWRIAQAVRDGLYTVEGLRRASSQLDPRTRQQLLDEIARISKNSPTSKIEVGPGGDLQPSPNPSPQRPAVAPVVRTRIILPPAEKLHEWFPVPDGEPSPTSPNAATALEEPLPKSCFGTGNGNDRKDNGDGDEDKVECTCEWAAMTCGTLMALHEMFGQGGDMAVCEEALKICLERRKKFLTDAWPHNEEIPTKGGVGKLRAPDFKKKCPKGVK